MTDHLHPFGPHFKRWRERRGYSLKEAAGDIVSPQFLSQFEREQKSITVDKLSRLLIAIGVDITDFMMDYTGAKLEKYNQNYVEAMKDPKAYLESLKPYYADNPGSLELLNYCLQQMSQRQVLSMEPAPPLPSHRIMQLIETPNWNLLEMETLFILLEQEGLDTEQTEQITHIVLNQLEESTTGNDQGGTHIVNLYNQLTMLHYLVRQLSRYGSYDLALSTTDNIRKLVSKVYTSDLMFLTILVRFDITEVYTWLRMGELAKAQKAYHRLMDYLNATIAYDANPQITESFVGYRSTFQLDFQRLLKEYQNKK